MLLCHKVVGVNGICIHERALFDRLVATQERTSTAIFEGQSSK
jgi:hypothetical protein